MRRLPILLLALTESTVLSAAMLSGVVRDQGGYAVERAIVWAVAEDCLESQRAVSDEQGQYTFPRLPPGAYRVFATHMGFWQGEKTIQLGREGSTNLDLKLLVSDTDTGGSPPSTPLSGIITDATGHPITGARIYYSDLNTSSGSDGRFGFCRVKGARVELRIEHQDYVTRTIKLEPGADQAFARDLKIELRKR